MKTPDITPAQIVSVVLALIGMLVAFGLNVSKAQQDAIVQVITVGFPAFLIADSYLRGKRNEAAAAAHNLAAAQTSAFGSSPDQGDKASAPKK